MLDHSEEHVAHFGFVFRGHQDHVRNAAQVCDVEQAVMCRTIPARYAAAIQTELDVQILDADIVN